MALLGNTIILITGASGFLGSHCLARLAQENCVLHAVNRAGHGDAAERVTWHAGDLRNPEVADALVRRIRPTHLLHNAWIATPGAFWTAAKNIDWLQAGLALLRAFGECGGRRFVGVGTCAEYDWEQTDFREDRTPIRPATLYGKSKAAMWAAAQAYGARYGFSAAWGRVFVPYGPGDAPQRLIPTLIAGLRAGEPVLLSEGTQERDFVHAADVADLLVHLLDGEQSGAFNVGTGRATTIRSVAEHLADRLGGRALLRFGAVPTRTTEPARLVADTSKVRAALGWSAARPLEDALEMLIHHAIKPANPR